VPATTLLRAFGIETDQAIKELFFDVNKGQIDFIDETIKKDPTHNQAEALVEIYQRLRPGDFATADTAKELIWNMFFNFERYDLSKVGRWKMNKRLPQLAKKGKNKNDDNITINDRVLTVEDIVAVIKEIIRLNNDPAAKPDEIDHLGNRRVRTLNELLINRLRIGFMRMERIIKDRMSTIEAIDLAPMQLINPRPVIAVIKEFFSSSQLSQFMDNENPLSELEHKRRLAATGPGGLTRERAGFEVRDVQPSHYGRICPIQTPEGPNVGLVGYLASFTKINAFGFLETPYFKVENGVVTQKLEYMTADEEEKYNIAIAAVPLDEKNAIIPQKVEARLHGEPGICDKNEVDYIDVSPQQILSVGTSLIPFLQNDDANRALMGSNMQRQSTPLIKPQPPLVMTGVEEKIAHDSGHIILAEGVGTIKEVDGNHITVDYDDKNLGQKTYNLRTFLRTNQYTCFHQTPIAKKTKS